MNIFEFVLKLQGFSLADSIHAHLELQKKSPDAFLEFQNKKKWEIFEYHCQHTKWYADINKDKVISDWETIPITTKSQLQKPLPSLISDEYVSQKLYLNNTSGSTGKPFHFAKDKRAHALTWSYIFLKYSMLDLEYGRSLQARFFGIPLTKKGYWKEKLKDFVSSRVRFPVFDLSDRVLEVYIERFRKSKFEYVYGYTSSLVLLAIYIIRQNIVLKDICPTLRWCIVTSEVCSSQDREVLQRAFGVKVINEYGAAELDIIAFEDQDGDWLLNEENLYIEVIGEDGMPVVDGQPGSVVVTSLYNRAMPFIRYNLGDIVSLYSGRKGIHRRIKSMEGRTNDVAVLPSGKKSPGLTFYYISKSLLEKGGFLKEFTIKQFATDHFHFEYVSDGDLSNDQKQDVERMTEVYLEKGLKVTFERKEAIQRTRAGKFKHFQSLLPR